ncbi:non-canonical purine NTP pyrophosphatase [Candidatus Gottesmanbacteria bacterium]|nr:non-canonical purine NTP pyrophosphatase [Candidatus Gottesmanbacteria bacterium]
MKKLLIATTNQGKLREISSFLSDLTVTLLGLKELGISEHPEEVGKTLEENAILKATYYAEKSGLPTIADDGGAEIDALDGEPGVKTRRWVHSDRDSTDEELIAYTLEKLKGVPLQERGMQLRAVIALSLPNGKYYTATAKIRGVIAIKPSPQRHAGFPFRSLMYIPQLGKFYNHDLMTPEENDVYNHRKKALEELKSILRKYLNG